MPACGEQHRIRLTLQYAGTAYAGWQVQPGRATVQGTIEGALARILAGESPRLSGAGRTDAGVHARAQVAHFDTSCRLDAGRIGDALNHLLPWDIRVTDAAAVSAAFHARASALSKEYRYRLHLGWPVPPEAYPYALDVRSPLDIDAMQRAARTLIGEHDFGSFRSAGSSARTTRRRILCSAWSAVDRDLVYRVEADGFLYKMVRSIVGTLLEVGRGDRRPESIEDLLRLPDRARAGPVVTSRGLHLWRITYPAE